ncbi:glycosyltransferase [Aliarcobacter butzleri]|uniref:glycosyltransferase n=1 Tax=Aliarcobacter butzleri TaxID=28197 RepID=UPI001EDC3D96|nr:glycosyltransferase [Aliarcobacter butzleri]MCG3710610.1 glycosyltransferase [Aliarcobacter butzleri]MCG3714129.1 glycosyltransferase [Aliarcobacter butzleri]
MYDYLIVTHIPAFYKINLYNELSKKLKIFIVFIASNTNEKRADDFVTLEKATFEYQVLFDGNFQDRNVINNIWKLREVLKMIAFRKLLLSGWDLKEFWYLVMTNSKSKNCLALESTINESRTDGIRGFIKKIFLSRISTVYASGKLHVALLNNLGYKNDIKITKGVGIINKPSFEFINKEYKKRFLFIGRLSSEKNLMTVIKVFNTFPEYTLTLIGTGNQEQELKSIANSNIIFVGQVENSNLQRYFINNDIFILPSISEPWGLVVEEALNFGLPVIVSKNCGASELIEDGVNGYILDFNNIENIRKKLLNINNEIYQKLLCGVKKHSINHKDDIQIESYL